MGYVLLPADDEVRITRYVLGEGLPEDQAATALWITREPGRRQRELELRQLFSTGAVAASQMAADTDTNGAWTAIAHAMMAPRLSTSSVQIVNVPQRMRAHWGWTAVVAAVLVIGLGGTWLRFGGNVSPLSHVQDIASAPGSRTTVTLRDGTRIVLGPGSRLQVSPDFGTSQRLVMLEGEGLFTVVHDSRRPFAVRTLHSNIRDIGTTFVVKAYADDSEETVAVEEGQVDLATEMPRTGGDLPLHGAALFAGDIATIDGTKTLLVHHANVALMTLWIQGRLAFEDTPLRDAVREVSRMYGLQVTIPDSLLANKLITASFTNESADDVLDAITRAVRARYERTGHTVVIRRQTGNPKPPSSAGHALRIAGASVSP